MTSCEFHPKSLAAIAWAWAKLAQRNMTMMDHLASHCIAHIKKGQMRSKELASIAWSFACFALYHEPLQDTLANSLQSVEGPRDLATMAWCLARLRDKTQGAFAMISKGWMSLPSKASKAATPMDLANLAWSLASVQHLDPPVMANIVESSVQCIKELDARQVASIVWSCAQLKVNESPLMLLLDALDGPLLDELPVQQVGSLADSMSLQFSSSLQERVTERLGRSVRILEERLTRIVPGPDGFSEKSPSLQCFAAAVQQLGADQLGDSGSCELLRTCGIAPKLRLSSSFAPDSKRLLVKASAIYDIKVGHSELQGSYVAVSGVDDSLRGTRWISPIQLPLGKQVDRSLCGEFQVLAKLCDEVIEHESEVLTFPSKVTGTLQLFVTAAPCLSCIAAVYQFHRLFPKIKLDVSWDSKVQNSLDKLHQSRGHFVLCHCRLISRFLWRSPDVQKITEATASPWQPFFSRLAGVPLAWSLQKLAPLAIRRWPRSEDLSAKLLTGTMGESVISRYRSESY